jgi:hypothetical protein
MLHPPYTSMVLSFVIAGALLAPRLSWTILVGSLLAYFLGLGVGAHFLDQLPGMGSKYVRHWPTWALWTVGLGAISVGVMIGLLGAFLLDRPALIGLVVVQGVCALGYPLAPLFGGAFHRDSVFAISWGSLPCVTSYFAQTGGISILVVIIAIGFAAVAVVEIKVSRMSRRLRLTPANLVRNGFRPEMNGETPYRTPDLILQGLSLGTVLLALIWLAGRVLSGG